MTRPDKRIVMQVWTNSLVTDVDASGVRLGEERIGTHTVLWAAGVRASDLGAALGSARDPQGRVIVNEDLTLPDHPATIGRSRAVVQVGRMRISGWFAWLTWLLIHIYYLSGFKNRLFVLFQWAWSYVTFARGARLIVHKHWRSYPQASERREDASLPASPTRAHTRDTKQVRGSARTVV